MDRRPPGSEPDAAPAPDRDTPGIAAADFREALSHWAGSVTLVAVRDEAQVHATTVTSFFPVSADPPLIAVSLGPGAQVLPWLDPGARFAVSLLAVGQASLATRYADAYPVGSSPFPTAGDPVVAGAVAALVCEVVEVHPVEGGARLVVARVARSPGGAGGAPLVRHRRRYVAVDPGA